MTGEGGTVVEDGPGAGGMVATAGPPVTGNGAPEAGLLSVVIADKVLPLGLRPLLEDERFDVVLAHDLEGAELEEALAGAHGLVVRSSTTVDREYLARCPRLRVIGRAGVGVDNIDLVAATERGIPVMNAPAGNTVSAAELTIALLLSAVRRVPAAERSLRAGEWTRSRFAGMELRGKTLGLIGAGRIGGEVARRARAFGMKVLAHDPYLTAERAEDLGVEPAELERVLDEGNVISLHVPLTASTRGMIGKEELERMKAGAFLVNVARGGVVDEDALAAALEAGEIAGAALDVYAEEPLPEDSPLRSAPNLVLTPHLGAATAEAQELVATEIAGAVRAALLEGDLSRALNAPAIGGEALRRARPLLELGGYVGRLACALAPGGIQELEIRHAGPGADHLKSLSASVAAGLLANILGSDQVNFVNALHLAEARGIKVTTASASTHPDYTDFTQVALETEGGPVRVAGALLGESHPRIVRIDDYHVDVVPGGSLIVIRNRDVPGVIGKVGTLLGSHGINIAEYHQARQSAGGDALAAVSVDGEVTSELVDALEELPEIADVRVVEMG